MSTNSFRWAGRTRSQQRRQDWIPPDVQQPLEKEDIIARYSDASHLLGSATESDLMMTQTSGSVTAMAGESNSATSASELPTMEMEIDRYFVARDDWIAPASNYLSLRRGDMIKITHMTEDGKSFGVGSL